MKLSCTVDDVDDKNKTLFYCFKDINYGSSSDIYYCLKNSVGALTVCGNTGNWEGCTYTNPKRCPYSIYYSRAVSNIQFGMLTIISMIVACAFYQWILKVYFYF